MIKFSVLPAAALFAIILYVTAFGWGGDAHRLINRGAVGFLPGGMTLFVQDSAFLAQHASDADYRKDSKDTSYTAEYTRHFIDIDDYPDFKQLPRDFGAVVALYGWTRVKENGVLPWALVWSYDSLVAQLHRGDWSNARQTASDIGHYAGDAQQPLHTTVNYNGQLTGNGGIHSRYESTMLNSQHYLSSLTVRPDTVWYIADRIGYAFEMLLHANSLVDSLLRADNAAKIASGWNGSGTPPGTYYAVLWQQTGAATLDQLQRAAQATANLWYSAWVDAGLLNGGTATPRRSSARDFALRAVFPNPAAARVTVSYELPVGGSAVLTLCGSDGAVLGTRAAAALSSGSHSAAFDVSGLPPGVYFATIDFGRFRQTAKILVAR
jgi:hypothetical protein